MVYFWLCIGLVFIALMLVLVISIMVQSGRISKAEEAAYGNRDHEDVMW